MNPCEWGQGANASALYGDDDAGDDDALDDLAAAAMMLDEGDDNALASPPLPFAWVLPRHHFNDFGASMRSCFLLLGTDGFLQMVRPSGLSEMTCSQKELSPFIHHQRSSDGSVFA